MYFYCIVLGEIKREKWRKNRCKNRDILKTEGQRERERNRQTDRQTERETERKTERDKEYSEIGFCNGEQCM